MRLSRVVLPTLKAAGQLAVPTYEAANVQPGILQIGVGNFFRSHFSAYVHDLLDDPATFESNAGWGIVGASVGSSSNEKKAILEEQDYLVTNVNISKQRLYWSER